MNRQKHLRSVRALATLLALSPLSLSAATLYWDINGDTAGIGGTGAWDTTSAFWSASSAGTGVGAAWNNTTNAPDTADFRGTGGTVTVDAGGVRAGGLAFSAGVYTLTGGAATLTGVTLLNAAAASGNVTLDSDLVVDSTTFTGAQSLVIQSAAANTLTLNGDLLFAYTGGTATGAKTISLRGNNAGSVMVLNGNIAAPVGGTATASLQLFGVSGARYEINGDNSGLTASQSGQIVRGTALLGHARAFNTGIIQLGISSTSATDTAAVLTNAALTIGNNISVGGANAASQLVVGGATAVESSFTGTMGGGTGAQNMRFAAVSGGRVNFSGSFTGSGSGLFIKQGAGVVALTRPAGNTYTRNTEVHQGALVLGNTSGSATGTTNTLTVFADATLAGTGFSTSAVVASAETSVFSPGDMTKDGVSSLGTLTLSGGLTAASGATFAFDINGASVDTINFGAGALALAGDVNFDFTSLGTVQTGVAYSLFTGSGNWSGSVGASFFFDAPAGYVLDTSFGGGNGYVFDAGSHTLQVQFASAIPEPSTFALVGGVAALGLAATRRRRASRSV